MSNRGPRRYKRRKRLDPIDPESPLAKIAEATKENPRDVQAALAALLADGFTWDECWDWLHEVLDDGEKIVNAAAQKLGTRK